MAYWTEYKSGGHRGFKLVASNGYELMYLSNTFSRSRDRWSLRLAAFGVTGNPILDAPFPLSVEPAALKDWAICQFNGQLRKINSALRSDWQRASFGPYRSIAIICEDSNGNAIAGITPKQDTHWVIDVPCLHGFGIKDLFSYEEYPSPIQVLGAIQPAMKQHIGFLQSEINNIQQEPAR